MEWQPDAAFRLLFVSYWYLQLPADAYGYLFLACDPPTTALNNSMYTCLLRATARIH
jgi:hypothetical protein